MSGFIIKIIW